MAVNYRFKFTTFKEGQNKAEKQGKFLYIYLKQECNKIKTDIYFTGVYIQKLTGSKRKILTHGL
jgi:hypothetical protein